MRNEKQICQLDNVGTILRSLNILSNSGLDCSRELHVILLYAISTAANSAVHTFNCSHFQQFTLSNVHTFNRSHLLPLTLSTVHSFHRLPFRPITISIAANSTYLLKFHVIQFFQDVREQIN